MAIGSSFRLSADQREFQGSLREFFMSEFSAETLRSLVRERAFARAWLSIEPLGIFSYLAGEGAKLTDLALIAFEGGRALFPGALSDAMLAGPYLLTRALTASSQKAVHERYGDSLLTGAGRVAIAIAERGQVEEYSQDKQLKLQGELPLVEGGLGAAAVLVIVPAARKGARERVLLADARQLVMNERPSLDLSSPLCSISLNQTPTIALRLSSEVSLQDQRRAIRAVELAGVAARAVAMTVEYVKTRRQFGVPVGGFQAVQHQLADMHLKAEASRTLAQFAAWSVEHSPEQAPLSSRAALAFVARSAVEVCERAIQLHGGVGFTWEYELHLFLRRARAVAALEASGKQQAQELITLARG